MNLNELKFKLSGTANLQKPLKLGSMYDLTISDAEVRSAGERVPLDDGSYNEVYKLKFSELSEINIISEKEVVMAKPKRGSKAQKFRMSLRDIDDREQFYNWVMTTLIDNTDDVVKYLIGTYK
jgi:hypothetical protein